MRDDDDDDDNGNDINADNREIIKRIVMKTMLILEITM